jgi:hypothetical protein
VVSVRFAVDPLADDRQPGIRRRMAAMTSHPVISGITRSVTTKGTSPLQPAQPLRSAGSRLRVEPEELQELGHQLADRRIIVDDERASASGIVVPHLGSPALDGVRGTSLP